MGVLALVVPGSEVHAEFSEFQHEAMERAILLADVPGDVYGQPIAEIRFEGNRRVESEAMVLEIESAAGELVNPTTLAVDVRRLWAMGKFSDVTVSGELAPNGVVLTYTVNERPTIRKIIVQGNDKKKLDDINEVLDLEKNAILDLGDVKANVEKIRELYIQDGFFLADISYALQPVPDSPGQTDVVFVVRE
ncbi:MAG: POTRA domain-containing protein, partial [Nannocystaceae bacterium]